MYISMYIFMNICIASSLNWFWHRRWWYVEASWSRTYRSFHCPPYQRIRRDQPYYWTGIDIKIHVIHTCIMETSNNETPNIHIRTHHMYVHAQSNICTIIHSFLHTYIYAYMYTYMHFPTYFINYNSWSKKKHSVAAGRVFRV